MRVQSPLALPLALMAEWHTQAVQDRLPLGSNPSRGTRALITCLLLLSSTPLASAVSPQKTVMLTDSVCGKSAKGGSAR